MITDEQVKAAVSTYHDVYHYHPQLMDDMRKALEAHEQSKPKPEPVAWLVRRNGYENVTVSLSKDKAISYRHEVQMRSDLSGDLNEYRIEPLYTTPPTREPLSDYKLREILNGINEGDGTIYDFARAIEKTHEIGATND